MSEKNTIKQRKKDVSPKKDEQTSDTTTPTKIQSETKPEPRPRCGCAVDDLQMWVDDLTAKTKASNAASSFVKYVFILAAVVLFVSSLIGYGIYQSDSFKSLLKHEPIKYNDNLNDVPSYKWSYETNFFHNETSNLFRRLALNGESLSTIVEDNGVDSAGEAVPIGHVNCKHPYMTLNPQRTMCHFSNRLDVGMHFVKTGGFNGHIEYLDKMITRIIPFRKRLIQQQAHAYNSYINLKKLKEFNSESFLNMAKSICADSNAELFDKSKVDSIVNEIFQLDILLILPGQELPMHLNVPYFWGADRNNFPHWLLVVMKNSKLFENIFIPQVQVKRTNLMIELTNLS